MEPQIDLEELRTVLAKRNTESASGEEILAAREAILRSETSSKGRRVYSAGTLPRWVGYGALASCVLGLAVWKVTQPTLDVSTPVSSTTYSTTAGQRATITLSDGSRVTLAPESRLVISQDKRGARNATLDGHALFIIQSRTTQPFIVHTHNTTTRVLGTTFAVRGYRTDSAVRVVVSEGKVQFNALSASASSLVLVAGEAARVTAAGHLVSIPDLDLAAALGWTEGKLVFRRTPLNEVLRELERTYNVNFDIEALQIPADTKVTMTVEGDIQNALYRLSMALDVAVERRGRVILLLQR